MPNLSIQINGDQREIPSPCTVSDLLLHLEIQTPRIAVAINAQVIPRSTFAEKEIQNGDQIEILHAVGGG